MLCWGNGLLSLLANSLVVAGSAQSMPGSPDAGVRLLVAIVVTVVSSKKPPRT